MASKSFLMRDEVRDLYNKRAGFYDLAVWFYCLAGMPIGRWRRLAVEALALRRGETVIEIGCGTGLNFSLLERAVGSKGRIIGIDISEAMLERAKARVQNAGWSNVKLLCRAAADYRFPDRVDGILSTGAITFEPEFDKVIERGAKALAPGRRWVVVDFKMPSSRLRYLAPLVVAMSSFGVSVALTARHPWKSLQRHLRHTRMQELYGGFAYIAYGEALSRPK